MTTTTAAWLDSLLRTGRSGRGATAGDLAWLIGLALLLVGAGLGLRDPWPADEPRFALIARDMVRTGDWLIPRIGGDLYPDKPPLFFWLIALGYWATGSLRIAFLLPSLLATIGSVLLVQDLARRLWSREAGLAAGLLLLFSFQFCWQGRQAQIDATLCFWTTLGVYGLLRHLLLGPAWRWYAAGWAAAGFGVITKGVGFLPILLLIPYGLASAPEWRPRPVAHGGARWLLGPLAFIGAIGVWLLPMLIVSTQSEDLAAYRDEILFRQTLTRYASAWHHREPFWFFLVEVIPWLWLPFTLLLPWLLPRWKDAFVARELRVMLPLAWALLVVLFFSLSSGKRGVYILPALPALVLAAAPWAAELLSRRGVERAFFALSLVLSLVIATAAGYVAVSESLRTTIVVRYAIDPVAPLAVAGALMLAMTLAAGPARGAVACAGAVAVVMLVTGFWINPAIDGERSSRLFVREVERRAADISELGLVAYKEQYLLQSTRPTFNFGHARWREAEAEMSDAAAWLEAAPGRGLLVDEDNLERCFSPEAAIAVGAANRQRWYLVTVPARRECVVGGDPAVARYYDPR